MNEDKKKQRDEVGFKLLDELNENYKDMGSENSGGSACMAIINDGERTGIVMTGKPRDLLFSLLNVCSEDKDVERLVMEVSRFLLARKVEGLLSDDDGKTNDAG